MPAAGLLRLRSKPPTQQHGPGVLDATRDLFPHILPIPLHRRRLFRAAHVFGKRFVRIKMVLDDIFAGLRIGIQPFAARIEDRLAAAHAVEQFTGRMVKVQARYIHQAPGTLLQLFSAEIVNDAVGQIHVFGHQDARIKAADGTDDVGAHDPAPLAQRRMSERVQV